MANWKNNLSNGYTWLVLVRLKQTNVDFESAQSTKISSLTFYQPTLSNELLRAEANNLANTIHTVFTAGMGARLEDGVSVDEAIASMVGILTNGEKTIEDFAVNNDAKYFFLNELKSREQ